jgi:hypothetical protein
MSSSPDPQVAGRESPDEPNPYPGPGEPYPVPDPGEPYPVPDPQRALPIQFGGTWTRGFVDQSSHRSRPLRLPLSISAVAATEAVTDE